jgi:hypothetical protein
LRRSIFNSLINTDALKSLKDIGANVGANKKALKKRASSLNLF